MHLESLDAVAKSGKLPTIWHSAEDKDSRSEDDGTALITPPV
jgi:hypothetical protein